MNKKLLVLLPIAAVALAACSIVNTTASQVALQYGGGPFDSKSFKDCTGPSTHQTRDVSDTFYYAPLGQRDYSFGIGRGEDTAALTSVTKDGQQISVTGTVKFTLNTDCTPWKDSTGRTWPGGRLQAFWELIGKKYDALPTDADSDLPAGWDDMLDNYLGAAVDRASDTEALNFGWQALYTSAAATTAWSQQVQTDIPKILNSLTLGTDLIHIDVVLLQKPGIQEQLQAGLASKQAAILRQQSAAVDEQAAKSFPGGVPGYQAYQQQQAVNQAIESGKVKVIPIPEGSSIVVQGAGG